MSVNPSDYFVGMQSNSFSSQESLVPNANFQINAEYSSPLYRVLPRKYAETWIKSGELRLSPLHSYREVSLGTRSDPREGALNHTAYGDNQFHWRARNALSLSLSRYPLRQLLSKFENDDADPSVTVEIASPNEWLRSLDKLVRDLWLRQDIGIQASVANDVAYSDVPGLNFGPQGAAINCAFVKPHIMNLDGVRNEYWLEAEVRVLWQPDANIGLKHLLVRSPSLAFGCRVLADSELLDDSYVPEVRVRRYGMEEHKVWTKSLGHPVGMTAWHKGNRGNTTGGTTS